MRTYIRIKYKYDRVYDSECYKEAALIINRGLMRKLDSESPEKANESHGEIVVSSKQKLSISEMKEIIRYLWTSIMKNATGCWDGFYYKDLRPNSFEVSIEEVDDKDFLQTARDIIDLSDNIIECFAMQDMNRVFHTYNERKREIESDIKTIADCLYPKRRNKQCYKYTYNQS